MGMIYYRAADCAFWASQLGQARRFAGQSIRRLQRLRGLWLWLALGKAGRGLAGRIYPNPYLPGGISR
jgi:hypothetical protein